MKSARVAKLLALLVTPLCFAASEGAFAILFGCSARSAATQMTVCFLALSLAGVADLLREPLWSSNAASAPLFLVRHVCALVLPFLLTALWTATALGLDAKVNCGGLVFPFAIGVFLGRAAIENHYFRRGSPAERFDIESVYYHDDHHSP